MSDVDMEKDEGDASLQTVAERWARTETDAAYTLSMRPLLSSPYTFSV